MITQVGSDSNNFYNQDNIDKLPKEVMFLIFEQLKENLSEVALVSKNWKSIADDEEFQKRIYPFNAFGEKEWIKYIGVIPEKQLPLPRRSYRDLEDGHKFLAFLPEAVGVNEANGKKRKVSLDSLNILAALAQNCKKDHKIIEKLNFVVKYEREHYTLKKSHWVCVKEDFLDYMLFIDQKIRGISEENNRLLELMKNLSQLQ